MEQRVSIWFAVWQLIIFFVAFPAFSLNEYELPSTCRNSERVVNVLSPDTGYRSSGVLVTRFSRSYLSNSNCSFVLRPNPGVSVLLAIRKFDFRSNCKDNVTIYRFPKTAMAYCGYRNSENEYETIVSNSDMRVVFQSGSGFTTGYKGFELVFTGFYESSSCWHSSSLFRCGNRRCISSSLRCDGHNHCGDRSDQNKCGPTAGAIAGYAIGCIFLFIAVVAGIIYCTKRRNYITTTTTLHPPPTAMNPPPYPTAYPTAYQHPQSQQPYNPNYKY